MTPVEAIAGGVIRRLDAKLINQIAAGEVIVRPASAIKELIENSLDAGTTRIDVGVDEDARSFWVRDDGAGMSEADARLAVERYATSKIREFEDLASLATRGFRGEALAAISSVSRFEMVTRRADEDGGTELRCEGGENLRVRGIGAPSGTVIRVRDLFHNTPARMKFMRAPVVEWGYILKEFVRQALTRPDVAFSILWRGKPYLTLAGGQTLMERLRVVLPGDAGGDLLEADQAVQGVRARGCIGSPRSTRRDRRHQYFFANGRPIVSRPLTFALQEAYRGLIMTQQFPVAALFLEIPGDEIDVNVHPTKEEVRFRNEPLAAGAIHRAALEALRKADIVPRIDLPGEPGGAFARRAPMTIHSAGSPRPEPPPPVFFTPEPAAPSAGLHAEASNQPNLHLNVTPENGGSDPSSPLARANEPKKETPVYGDDTAIEEGTLIRHLAGSAAPPRVVAQIERTYIMAEAPGQGVLLVDQHAAHEKILYLDYMSRPRGREVQTLLVPYTFEAAPGEAAAMEMLAPALSAEGFETSHFGGGTFVIESVPVLFERVDVSGFLRDLLDDLGGGDLRREISNLRHKIGARAACRAAVMAGDPLGHEEMQSLLDRVLQTAEALRCPHGRPTMVLLSKDQLDRRFGRI